MIRPKLITLELAVTLCRTAEAKLSDAGYHCALTGSCLYKGQSTKDVDILIYPHDPMVTISNHQMKLVLESAGFIIRYETDPDYVNREVWLCAYQGTRVDFFLR